MVIKIRGKKYLGYSGSLFPELKGAECSLSESISYYPLALLNTPGALLSTPAVSNSNMGQH